MQHCKRIELVIAFLVTALVGPLHAQSTGGQNSDEPISAGQIFSGPKTQTSVLAGPELPANRILTILQENPDIADNLRAAALQNGATGTDEQFAQRLQADQSFRIQITRYLIDQGVVDASDPELRGGQGQQSISDGFGDQSSNGQDIRAGQVDQDSTEQVYPSRSMTGQNVRGPGNYGAQTRPQNGSAAKTQRERAPGEVPARRQKLPLAYEDIPAMRDLYSQVNDFSERLERFGASTVRGAAVATTTADVSASSDYVLGAGDGLSLVVWGGISRTLRLTIDREGRIALPEVGTVLLAGKTLDEARGIVQSALSSQFHNIHSDVSLARVRFVRVYVVGDVQNPGAYDVSGLSTVLNAIAIAGGPTARGSLRRIQHRRGDTVLAEIDLYDLLLKGVRGSIGGLASGDTILVPTIGPQVTVAGMVRRPAIYELKQESNLSQLFDLAGGVLSTGSLREVRVERVEAHEKKVMLSLKLPEVKDAEGLKSALAGFKLQDGDRVLIGAIAPYSNQAVYLDGHVLQPGKYSYHEGMEVSEVVRSYQDLMPEASDHAEIIRLRPPEMRPDVIEFNLRKVLSDHESIKLQPFDTVRVYGRYDVDAPTVAIYGEVMRPGEYPMSEGMTAVELIRMAGGLKRSAYTETADLASYTIDQNKSVGVDSRIVDIGRALKGEQDTDVRLKPRDVLTIRQLAGWDTVGTVVKVSGEVNYPGTYGIVEGERLSSVLHRAGGFRNIAYPRGALLIREEVRKINEKARDALISRVETMVPDVRVDPSSAPGVLAAAQVQQEQMVKRLKATPPSGRQVIQISTDISKWENTAADIELRPGDEVVIPKYPTFVTVQGQVNSPTAITYVPGEKASWYFKRAGGSTPAASMKDAFIIRADGSVIGRGSNSGFWSGSVMSSVMYPGDTVVIPEKIITGNTAWRGVLQTIQVMSQVAITAGVISNF